MPVVAESTVPRQLSSAELGAVIKMFREARSWSQEQLADISRLSTRTVQRVESGRPSDIHTRQALARAFDAEDIDLFNKPYAIPTEEDMKEARATFEREHVTLTAHALTTGRQLARLAEIHSMDLSTPGFDMDREAAEVFAALVDYLRDYRDCHDAYPESGKFDVYDALQTHIDDLKKLGVSLRYAERNVNLTTSGNPAAQPWAAGILYLVPFRLGHEPEHFATPRKVHIG